MTNRIFLSHSSLDLENVRRLAEDLRRSGVEVWLDASAIGVGDPISQKIQEGLQSTDYLAVWLTRNAIESGWVQREWQSKYGDEVAGGRVIVLPLLAEDCKLPPLLADKRYADFRLSYEQGLTDLLRVVGLQQWENSIGMKFALVVPGAFSMGSEDGEENERPVHAVTVGRPFYIGIHTVTQGNWGSVLDTEPWTGQPNVREGESYPAVHVSWYDALDFLNRLSALDDQNSYYLPNEQEWEYAARAGTSTEFSFGDDERDLRLFGWYRDLTQGGEEFAHEVGRKRPNPWGIYDMHGNVWEWMDDWYYGSYAAKPTLKPTEKVLRGGGWDYPAHGARSAFRNHLLPTRSLAAIGFRLIRRSA
jgi:formylglycine-generating enzyme required for sulfatase activity